MTIHLGDVQANSTLYIPFATYDANGASVTMSGFATSDILIYKNGSTTQRSSTNGFTLLDTDGTDFDGVTGLQGFSIDLSDNTDASFYSVGAFYWVVISTVTVSSQTVTLIAATFRITDALDMSDVHSLLTLVRSDTTHIESDAANVENVTSDIQSDTNKLVSDATEADASDILSRLTITNSQLLIVKSDTSDILSFLTAINNVVSDIQSDTNKLVSDATEADASDILSRLTVTNSQLLIVKSDTSDILSLLTLVRSDTTHIESDQASQFTVLNAIVSDIQSDTNKLVSDATEADASDILSRLTVTNSQLLIVKSDTSDIMSLLTLVRSDTTAVETKTAGLTFTVAGQVDANIESVNGTEVVGSGTGGDPWGPAP